MSRKNRGAGPPQRGQNPALLALQQRKRVQKVATTDQDRTPIVEHPALFDERYRLDVQRAFLACEQERLGAPGCRLAEKSYSEILARREGDTDVKLACYCLEGLSRVQQMLRQHEPERYPLDLELDLAQRLLRLRCNAPSYYRLGQALLDLARPEEALAAGESAVTLDPELLPTWELVARCWRALGDRARGRQTYEHLLQLPAQQPHTLHWRAVALLMTGNYAEGWPAYNTFVPPGGTELPVTWRGPFVSRLLAGPVPLWTGKPLPDGRLLLFFDGGFGDAFQMARWVPAVRARVAALRLAVGPKLIGFFSEQGWDVEPVPWHDCGTGYDQWLNIDGLPGVCGCARPEDVPPAPYLCATRVRPPLAGTFKVGLVWAGQPGHPDDEMRSTTLANWAPVLETPGVTFYSLQLGSAATQVESCEYRIHDLSSELTDWRDTAAVLQQLDLLIAVDSAVANLAGAMGRPVWVALYPVSDWRWLLEGSTTPWYPTARIFRQNRIGDWSSVFEAIAGGLRQMVAAR